MSNELKGEGRREGKEVAVSVMLPPPKEKESIEKKAIEVIEMVAKEKNLTFQISFKPRRGGYSSPYADKWKIQVLGQIFSDEDFKTCVGEAMKFINKVHYQ